MHLSKRTKKACFPYDMVYEDFKKLSRKTAAD